MSPGPHSRPWRIVHSEASLGWGGQERRILAEMEVFRAQGADVTLWAPALSRIRSQAVSRGLAFEAMPDGRLRFPWAVLRMATFLRRRRIQVLNPHSSRDSWIAGLAGRLAGVPLIIRSRHFDVPIGNPALSRVVYCLLADHIITTSPRITQSLRETFALPESRVSTIPTGIDLNLFRPDGPRAEVALPDAARSLPLVAMIGVFRRAKGHETLIRAASLLQRAGFHCHYLLVGEGPMIPLSRQWVGELGLEASFTFLGEREDIPELLRRIDLLVMPSLHEGIPQVGLQALACGAPLVASNVGGLPSIIQDGVTGALVSSREPEAWASAIRGALSDREGTREKAARGRAFVAEHHGLDRMAEALRKVYLQYLGPTG
ncbi:MAG: glycosyltransferase family 4 protein [Verrucomicrobia bacterium]|nr:glycosyltransferase family 4 protein [Verrucomicrobiota bacterium]MBI3867016.1 glycosyltransferase family 4 protein [Verrucomicrobiota bacterium]